MNRRDRRRLQKAAKGKLKGVAIVELVGGPMNSWKVKPDAPALRPDWGEIAGHPGFAYIVRERGQAFWEQIVGRPG